MSTQKILGTLLVLSMVLMTLSLAAPVGAQEPVGSVGIIVRTMVNDPFQVAMAESAEQKANELGLKPLVYAPTGHADVQEQMAIVEDLIQQKVSGILLAPLDTQALKAAMEAADAAGIPVVLFDSNPIEDAPFITAIGTDNVAAASLAADYLIDLGPEGGDRGGQLLASGTPEEVCEIQDSATGQVLKQYFKEHYDKKC